MRTAAALLFALVMPSAALAAQQDEPKPEFVPQPATREIADFGLAIGAHGRYSIPFGAADSEISWASTGFGAFLHVDVDIAWTDLFHPGFGLDVELDLFIGRERPDPEGLRDVMRYGFYVSVSHDEYQGDDATEDDNRIDEVDDLELTSLIAGAKLESSMGPGAFLCGRFGLGVVRYSEVKATFSSPGTPTFRGELLDRTHTVVVELRMGGGLELGPVNFTAGMGFRLQLPPSEGSDIDLDTGLFMAFDLEVGAEIGF